MDQSCAHLWVVSGPSGVGKGTVCTELRRQRPSLLVSTSATTRPPRPDEVDGETYHFVTPEAFDALVSSGAMLEHACVHGRAMYGTPRRPVEEALASGRTVLLEIDLQGARQVKHNMPKARLVFLAPPTWEELVARLSGRGTETEGEQDVRLATARQELADQDEADFVIVNARVEDTVQELIELMGL